MKLTIFLGLLVLTCMHMDAYAQQRHPGVALFEQGKYREAIKVLDKATRSSEHKNDAEIWNYLGLAYLASDEPQRSRKPLEKSVSLKPGDSVFRSNLAYSYLLAGNLQKAIDSAEKAIALDASNPGGYQVRGTASLWVRNLDAAERDADLFLKYAPTNPTAYFLKSNVLIGKLGVRVIAGSRIRDEADYLKRVMDTLEAGILKTKGKPGVEALERERDSLTPFHKYFVSSTDAAIGVATSMPATPNSGDSGYQILHKKPPSYTDVARSNGIEGKIQAAVLLGANGTVEGVLLLNRLGYGLDEQVMKVAREIRFKPKMKDGKPVSTVVRLEYTFDIY